MARALRVERVGAWYHVTSRGVDRRSIFLDGRDRKRWLNLMGEATLMFQWVVHAYVLMDNHYHLLLQIRDTNLSRGMQWLQTSYSMGFNRRYQRVGPLVQGRYKAVVVEPVSWGLELSRYVHLNPVRTALMGLDKKARQVNRLGIGAPPDAVQVRRRLRHLRSYRWSSFRAYAGLERAPEWLTCSVVLGLAGGGTSVKRSSVYARYVEEAVREGLEESPWDHVQSRLILGTKRFVAEVQSRLHGSVREQPQLRVLRERPQWTQIVRVTEQLRERKWEDFADRRGDWGRDLALYLGRRLAGLKLRELGWWAGGMDYAAVSVAIKRFERRLAGDGRLRDTVGKAARLLNVEI